MASEIKPKKQQRSEKRAEVRANEFITALLNNTEEQHREFLVKKVKSAKTKWFWWTFTYGVLTMLYVTLAIIGAGWIWAACSVVWAVLTLFEYFLNRGYYRAAVSRLERLDKRQAV